MPDPAGGNGASQITATSRRPPTNTVNKIVCLIIDNIIYAVRR